MKKSTKIIIGLGIAVLILLSLLLYPKVKEPILQEGYDLALNQIYQQALNCQPIVLGPEDSQVSLIDPRCPQQTND